MAQGQGGDQSVVHHGDGGWDNDEDGEGEREERRKGREEGEGGQNEVKYNADL